MTIEGGLADSERLDWLERTRATVYESNPRDEDKQVSHYFIVVPETVRSRRGYLGPTLRDAIDEARRSARLG